MEIRNNSNILKIAEKEREFTNKCRIENDKFRAKLDSFKIQSKKIELIKDMNPSLLNRVNQINMEIDNMKMGIERNSQLILNNDQLFLNSLMEIKWK